MSQILAYPGVEVFPSLATSQSLSLNPAIGESLNFTNVSEYSDQKSSSYKMAQSYDQMQESNLFQVKVSVCSQAPRSSV